MSAATKEQGSVWGMVRLGLVLAAYAVAACTVLAIVNNITAPVISANQERKANEAMRAVFPAADSFAEVDAGLCGTTASGNVTIDNVRYAVSGGAVIGAVAQVTGPTYDTATVMVGMTKDGTITGVQYLANTDTPGFGQKASDPTFLLDSGKTFYGQFEGKRASDGFIAGVTFDAISGATITSDGAAALLTAAADIMRSALAAASAGGAD